MRLENRSQLKLSHGADFDMRLQKSTLDCRMKQTLDATIVVDFVPCGVDFEMKKTKSTYGMQNRTKKSEKMNSCAAGAGLST
jgi:hypothetical protein